MAEHTFDSSTHERITNDPGRVIFPCPACGQSTIIRSSRSREVAIKYKCEKCGFMGPN